jgi:hypothetical protein
MPTTTYDLLASNVLGSATATVTFSSIVETYRDLVLVMNITGGNGDVYAGLRFNSDTTQNYNYTEARGDGTSTAAYQGSSETIATLYGAYASISNPASYVVNIMDYSATDKHKTFLVRSNRANQMTAMLAGHWFNANSRISSITIGSFGNGNTMAAGSSFYLYGIVS